MPRPLITCPNGQLECTRKKGETVRVRLVIDERPSFCGLTELYHIPGDQIYLVEVFASLIRVYTRDFVARAAAQNRIPL